MTPDSKRPIDWFDIAIEELTEAEAKRLLVLIYSSNTQFQAFLVGSRAKRSRSM